MSFASIPSKSLPAVRLRHAANTITPNNAMITAAGTHQLAATQSIQEPDSAGAEAGFFGTTGAGSGAGGDVLSTGGGTGVAVDSGGVDVAAGGVAAGGGALTVGAGLVWADFGGAGAGVGAVAVGGTPSLRCRALSSLFRISIKRCDSASCPSNSLTRSLSACDSALAAVEELPVPAAAPPPAVGGTRRRCPPASGLPALRHALIWRRTSPVASVWFRAAISSAPGTRSTAPRRRILMFPPNASGLARYTAIMV